MSLYQVLFIKCYKSVGDVRKRDKIGQLVEKQSINFGGHFFVTTFNFLFN